MKQTSKQTGQDNNMKTFFAPKNKKPSQAMQDLFGTNEESLQESTQALQDLENEEDEGEVERLKDLLRKERAITSEMREEVAHQTIPNEPKSNQKIPAKNKQNRPQITPKSTPNRPKST